jgi:hypothetical protein
MYPGRYLPFLRKFTELLIRFGIAGRRCPPAGVRDKYLDRLCVDRFGIAETAFG